VIAAVTTAEHGFDVVTLPDPTPRPDELVIRVAACGMCVVPISRLRRSLRLGW
jgi:(R,R)-butanediol dehydrogenase/meso-butanediol dehydrogenase/diacetyl reductase